MPPSLDFRRRSPARSLIARLLVVLLSEQPLLPALSAAARTDGPACPSPACDTLFFGPRKYLRTGGAPNVYTDAVPVPSSVVAPFCLHIQNGEADGSHRVSSAWIKVNGVQVAGPSDFGRNVAALDRVIRLKARNTLNVKLAGAPGAYLY